MQEENPSGEQIWNMVLQTDQEQRGRATRQFREQAQFRQQQTQSHIGPHQHHPYLSSSSLQPSPCPETTVLPLSSSTSLPMSAKPELQYEYQYTHMPATTEPATPLEHYVPYQSVFEGFQQPPQPVFPVDRYHMASYPPVGVSQGGPHITYPPLSSALQFHRTQPYEQQRFEQQPPLQTLPHHRHPQQAQRQTVQRHQQEQLPHQQSQPLQQQQGLQLYPESSTARPYVSYLEAVQPHLQVQGDQHTAESGGSDILSLSAPQGRALQPPVPEFPMGFLPDPPMRWQAAPPSELPVSPFATQNPVTPLATDVDMGNLGGASHSGGSPGGTTTTAKENRSRASSKRRIAQSACETCRRKRTKCVIDPGHIGCNVCRSLRIPCLFSGRDKRKESGLLRSRLAQLEMLVGKMMTTDQDEAQRLLSKLRSGEDDVDYAGDAAPPTTSGGHPSSDRLSRDIIAQERDKQQEHSPSSGASEGFGQRPVPPPKVEIRDSINMTTGVQSPQGNRLRQASDENDNAVKDATQDDIPNKAAPGSETVQSAVAVEDTLTELTDRLMLDDTGEIRAVSAASSLAFGPSRALSYKARAQVPDISAEATSAKQPSTPLEIVLGPGIELPDGTSQETVEHLLNLYFLWELPLHPVISRVAFLRDMAAGSGPYFSSMLLNSILAFACTLSDRPDLRADQDDPHTVGEHFFVMADDMLTEEFDGAIGPIRAPITMVQALVLLVSRLFATGNDFKAWMRLGTCTRMTLDLGLHLDARAFLIRTDCRAASPVLTEDDLYVRARTFWGVWIFEQEMCTIFGRTGILRDIIITCPFLEDFDTPWSKLEDFDWWESLQRGRIVTLGPTTHGARGVTHLSLSTPLGDAQVHQSALNLAMQKTRHLARSLPAISRESLEALQVPIQPPFSLLVLHLHLLIRSHVILVNRPFMSGSATRDAENNSPQSSPTEVAAARDSPRVRCLRSAVEIVALLDVWRKAVPGGLRTANIATAHILMSAATIFLNEMTSALTSSTHDAISSPEPEQGSPGSDSIAQFRTIGDHARRQEHGRERLTHGVLPILRDMAQYRPATHQLAGRLEQAMREREDLIRAHENRHRQP